MLFFLNSGFRLSDGLVDFYTTLENSDGAKRTQHLADIILKDARAEHGTTPLVNAIREAAKLIDDGTWCKPGIPYHNALHTREVACNNYVLSVLSRQLYTPPLATDPLEGFLAGLLHDVLHDGTKNEDKPYRIEKNSFDTVRPILEKCGMNEAAIFRIEMVLLATNVDKGQRALLKNIHDHHEKNEPFDPRLIPSDFDRRLLKALLEDRDICRQAALLCDSDLMPSIGMGYEWAMKNGHAYAEERKWSTERKAVHGGHLTFVKDVFIAPITPALAIFFTAVHMSTMDKVKGKSTSYDFLTRPLPRSKTRFITGRHAANP